MNLKLSIFQRKDFRSEWEKRTRNVYEYKREEHLNNKHFFNPPEKVSVFSAQTIRWYRCTFFGFAKEIYTFEISIGMRRILLGILYVR